MVRDKRRDEEITKDMIVQKLVELQSFDDEDLDSPLFDSS